MGGGVNELALFAGGGGGILGGRLLGWRTRCAVELDPYARRILLARQRDGMLEPFPIWDDVTTFDGRPWRGWIDVVSGGFPCTDIAAPGSGAGIEGEKSGLWREMARIIHDVRPRYVFVENSPMLTARGLGRVLGDLAKMGFDAEYGVLGAYEAGAPHKRDRIWIVAYSERARLERQRRDSRKQEKPRTGGDRSQARAFRDGLTLWQDEPAVGRVAHGVAHRVDRLRALGNGQVPAVAALAWRILKGRIDGSR
jgi:DNA (cytosine-5)-methyltransferase 1